MNFIRPTFTVEANGERATPFDNLLQAIWDAQKVFQSHPESTVAVVAVDGQTLWQNGKLIRLYTVILNQSSRYQCVRVGGIPYNLAESVQWEWHDKERRIRREVYWATKDEPTRIARENNRDLALTRRSSR